MSTLSQVIRQTRGSRSSHKEISEFCSKLLTSSEGKSDTDESWAAREQLAKACLDEGDVERAKDLVIELRKRFGEKSQRVSLLAGLCLEFEEKWSEAEALYEKMLQANKNNSIAGKRLAVIKRSQNDLKGCVKVLNSLIADNHADHETWFEMCDVQMLCGCYDAAAYCAEEVLLTHPYSYLSNSLYAEILFSASKVNKADLTKDKRLEDSRSYFSQSLVLNSKDNARAAWGLLLCCAHNPKQDDMTIPLSEKAVSILSTFYAKSPMKDLAGPVIEDLKRQVQ